MSEPLPQFWGVVCGSCHRRIGICTDKNPSRTKIFCSALCAAEQEVVAMSERQDMWDFLNAKGRSPVTVSKMFGSPHALVYRTLERLRQPLPNTSYPWLRA